MSRLARSSLADGRGERAAPQAWLAPVHALEAALDATDAPSSPWHPDALVALDEAERFPHEACEALDAAGLPARYVPVAEGGRLDRMDTALALLRGVARRDLTVAVAHATTLLASLSVWVAGDAAQRARCATLVREGGAITWGLTERARGDFGATPLCAHPEGAAWRLDGEKWLVNNATRGAAFALLARTDPAGGLRGLSTFFVDARSLDAGAYVPLAPVRTQGLRGADLRGARFVDARVPEDALVGEPGAGLATTLLSLQVTRTLCAGLSLGAAEAALEHAIGLANDRAQHGTSALASAYPRERLAWAYADLLSAELGALAAARLLHVAPTQASLSSSVVKCVVPAVTGRVVDTCAELLGARHHLREERTLRFQKIVRDHPLVGLFDGSAVVNLAGLASGLPAVVRAARPLGIDAEPFSSEASLAPWSAAGLTLTGTGRDDVSASLPLLRETARSLTLDAEDRERLDALLARLCAHEAALRDRALSLFARGGQSALRERAGLELARDHAELWLASATVGAALVERPRLHPALEDGAWLLTALAARLARFEPRAALLELPTSVRERTLAALLAQSAAREALSAYQAPRG